MMEVAKDHVVYEDVMYKGQEGGRLVLNKKRMVYYGSKAKEPSPMVLKIAWRTIAKYQINPKLHDKALLKLTSTNSSKKPLIFQMANRSDLELVHEHIRHYLLIKKAEEAANKRDAAATANGEEEEEKKKDDDMDDSATSYSDIEESDTFPEDKVTDDFDVDADAEVAKEKAGANTSNREVKITVVDTSGQIEAQKDSKYHYEFEKKCDKTSTDGDDDGKVSGDDKSDKEKAAGADAAKKNRETKPTSLTDDKQGETEDDKKNENLSTRSKPFDEDVPLAEAVAVRETTGTNPFDSPPAKTPATRPAAETSTNPFDSPANNRTEVTSSEENSNTNNPFDSEAPAEAKAEQATPPKPSYSTNLFESPKNTVNGATEEAEKEATNDTATAPVSKVPPALAKEATLVAETYPKKESELVVRASYADTSNTVSRTRVAERLTAAAAQVPEDAKIRSHDFDNLKDKFETFLKRFKPLTTALKNYHDSLVQLEYKRSEMLDVMEGWSKETPLYAVAGKGNTIVESSRPSWTRDAAGEDGGLSYSSVERQMSALNTEYAKHLEEYCIEYVEEWGKFEY
jgi:hypothetical protein